MACVAERKRTQLGAPGFWALGRAVGLPERDVDVGQQASREAWPSGRPQAGTDTREIRMDRRQVFRDGSVRQEFLDRLGEPAATGSIAGSGGLEGLDVVADVDVVDGMVVGVYEPGVQPGPEVRCSSPGATTRRLGRRSGGTGTNTVAAR